MGFLTGGTFRSCLRALGVRGGNNRLRLLAFVEPTDVAVVVTPRRRSGLGEEATPLDIAGGFNTSALELNFQLAPLTR